MAQHERPTEHYKHAEAFLASAAEKRSRAAFVLQDHGHTKPAPAMEALIADAELDLKAAHVHAMLANVDTQLF